MTRLASAFVLAWPALLTLFSGRAAAADALDAAAAVATPIAVETVAPAMTLDAATPAIATPVYKWGVGWDAGRGFVGGGVAIRRRLNEEWALGFIVDGRVSGNDDEGDDLSGDQSDDYSSASERQSTGDATTDAFGLRGFAYHESFLTEWFSLGPYFGLGYGFDRRDEEDLTIETRVSTSGISTNRRDEHTTTTSHSWVFTFGLRPSFRFDKRFILESRLGVSAIWSDTESQSTTYSTSSRREGGAPIQTSSSVEKDRSDRNSWRFSAFGQELGPGAVLTFIVCF